MSNHLSETKISKSHAERRRHNRQPCGLETWFHLVGNVADDKRPVRIRNISAGGVSLVAAERLEPQIVVVLDICNKARQFDCQIPIRILYVVCHPDGDYILGAEFCRELSPEEIKGLL